MNEQQALSKMVAPGTYRPGKYKGGIIQIHVTRACDKSCFACTQGSNLKGKVTFITPEQFEQAVLSLSGYFGVVGVFGGNPALHPQFETLCDILSRHVPFNQRGLWCNHPAGKAAIMRRTFDPSVSNLNVHLDRTAWDEFKRDWPESRPFGIQDDSRHSPPFVAMKDLLKKECPTCHDTSDETKWAGAENECRTCKGTGVVYNEERGWDLISNCDINQHWSAMIGVFRGELRAWFCEIAGAQAMLHQHEPDYPDTGYPIVIRDKGFPSMINDAWWRWDMSSFANQVRKHCHECGVPLRAYGELSQESDRKGTEQTTLTHHTIYQPKRINRAVELVSNLMQLGIGKLSKVTDYLRNGKK